jgi:hypothetical protein
VCVYKLLIHLKITTTISMRSIIALSAVALLASKAAAHVVEMEPNQLAQVQSDEKEDFGNSLVEAGV